MKVLWFLFLWVTCIVSQVLTPLFIVVVHVLLLTFLVFWFFVGVFLFQCRVFSVVAVRRFWEYFWKSEAVDHNTEIFDRRRLNESLLVGFAATTLPNLCVQVINNTLTKTWTPFQFISVLLSGYMIVNGLWKYCYWYVVRGVSLHDIPPPRLFPFKFMGDLNLESFNAPALSVEVIQGKGNDIVMLSSNFNSLFVPERVHSRHSV